MAAGPKAKKKKGLSHEPARISMRTNFRSIALRAQPSFCWFGFPFFFPSFLLPERKKMATKGQKKKKKRAKNTIYKKKKKNLKKKFLHFALLIFKKKKKSIALSFFGKSL